VGVAGPSFVDGVMYHHGSKAIVAIKAPLSVALPPRCRRLRSAFLRERPMRPDPGEVRYNRPMRAVALAWLLTLAGPARAEGPGGKVFRRVELMPSQLPPSDGDGRRPATPDDQMKAQAIEAAGRVRVRDGRVPPAWRETERRIREVFHPPLDAVATGAAPAALVAQTLFNKPEPRPDHRPGSRDFAALNDADLAHEAARRARPGLSVEVEARLGVDGRLDSARVVVSSGRPRLDQAALAAVQQQVGWQPPPVVDGLRVARFRISAARRVTPLDLNPVLSPRSGGLRGLSPTARFGFDEAHGKIKAERPFSQDVVTEVQLISLEPAPESRT
jgi:TonB family protein